MSFKATGAITNENESQMLQQLLSFDVPADPAAGQEFLLALEAIEPFSDSPSAAPPDSDHLFVAGNRLAAMTFIKLAQLGNDNGRPILQKLRAAKRVPAGGFPSVASFAGAVEAIYPGTFRENFLAARANLVGVAKAKLAAAAPKAEAPAAEAAQVEPLPDRETQVFDGISISHPAVLRDAIGRLGPELAALAKKARATIDERARGTFVAPVPITDATLEIIRSQGIEVGRDRAEFFSKQSAVLANSNQLLRRLFEVDSIQVWFRNDLNALLKEGRKIPGFSYNPATDHVNFAFYISGKGTIETGKPLDIETLKRSLASQPAPVFPIILKDRSVAEIKDVAEQVATIRKEDKLVIPLLQSAGTVTPAQLGIGGSELSKGGLLTPAQTVFSSVHEMVETSLLEHVVASADRRWFCEGLANLMGMRACDQQFGPTGENSGRKVFESLFNPTTLTKRAPEIDLLGWRAAENETDATKKDDALSSAHYYFTTRVLLAATDGRDEGFLKAWIDKLREIPWNRTNAATIIAAYDELTGDSLREIINKTVSAR